MTRSMNPTPKTVEEAGAMTPRAIKTLIEASAPTEAAGLLRCAMILVSAAAKRTGTVHGRRPDSYYEANRIWHSLNSLAETLERRALREAARTQTTGGRR